MRSLLSAAERGEVATSDKLHGPRQRVLLRTINGQITQRRACSPLHFGIVTAQKEKDRVECVAPNGSDLLLSNLGECECRATLEINIVRKRECGQRGKWCPREEGGGGSVWRRG